MVTGHGADEESKRTGLSRSEAMGLAEELQRGGHVAIVMHVVGEKSYEVDRYPVRLTLGWGPGGRTGSDAVTRESLLSFSTQPCIEPLDESPT